MISSAASGAPKNVPQKHQASLEAGETGMGGRCPLGEQKECSWRWVPRIPVLQQEGEAGTNVWGGPLGDGGSESALCGHSSQDSLVPAGSLPPPSSHSLPDAGPCSVLCGCHPASDTAHTGQTGAGFRKRSGTLFQSTGHNYILISLLLAQNPHLV